MTFKLTYRRSIVLLGICYAFLIGSYCPVQASQVRAAQARLASNARVASSVKVLVDDFQPQPYQGDPIYYYNRVEGDRGVIQNAAVIWSPGQVTMTISAGNTWGGVWTSLNHPVREGIPANFAAILPAQIAAVYQSSITQLNIDIASGTPGRSFKVELKRGGLVQWNAHATLNGGQQTLNYSLPPLGDIDQLVWLLDGAAPGDSVVVKRIALVATTSIANASMRAFVWSYGLLLNNWNPATGLLRDKAKDAGGEFDAIQATGALAAATVVAKQVGVVSQSDAIQIVNKISDALLLRAPNKT